MDYFPPRRKAVISMLGFLAASDPLRAQESSRPIRIVHGYVAGSNPDTIARLVAPSLEANLGRNVIVEGKPGAAERVAAQFIKSQPPDGNTLYLMTGGANVISATESAPTFDTRTDFTYLSMITEFPFVFLVGVDSPYKSFDDVIRAGKAGKTLSCGHGGLGTTSHLAAELVAQRAGLNISMVAYKDIGQMYTDLVAGRLDMTCSTFTVYGGAITQGKVRALAVSSKSRWPMYPAIPAVSESVKDVEVTSWMGFAMAAGASEALVARYASAIERAISDPAVQKRLKDMGNMPSAHGSRQFHSRVLSDYSQWRSLAPLIR